MEHSKLAQKAVKLLCKNKTLQTKQQHTLCPKSLFTFKQTFINTLPSYIIYRTRNITALVCN